MGNLDFCPSCGEVTLEHKYRLDYCRECCLIESSD